MVEGISRDQSIYLWNSYSSTSR